MKKPIVIPMEDPIIHTAERPVCGDPDCICAEYDSQQLPAETLQMPPQKKRRRLVESRPVPGVLNGNRPFRLLK
jgi:hypothetical protein